MTTPPNPYALQRAGGGPSRLQSVRLVAAVAELVQRRAGASGCRELPRNF